MVLVPIDSALGIHRVTATAVSSGSSPIAPSRASATVDFFGRPALLPSAQVALGSAPARRSSQPSRGERTSSHARIEEPLELVSTGDRDADVRSGVVGSPASSSGT